jgi:hypothetical protein
MESEGGAATAARRGEEGVGEVRREKKEGRGQGEGREEGENNGERVGGGAANFLDENEANFLSVSTFFFSPTSILVFRHG